MLGMSAVGGKHQTNSTAFLRFLGGLYYGFWYCVFTGFLCVHEQGSLCLSLAPFLLLVFVCFILFQFVSVCLILFYYCFLVPCLCSSERDKGCGFGWEGNWGRSEKNWGRGNYSQNILYLKKIYFQKKNARHGSTCL